MMDKRETKRGKHTTISQRDASPSQSQDEQITPPPLSSSGTAHILFPSDFVPGDRDIICGRGKAKTSHPGNILFTKLIKASLPSYLEAPKRSDKSIVVASLVTSIGHEGGRFIRQDKDTQRYYQITEDSIHEKVGHAIRDLASRLSERQQSLSGSTESVPLKKRRGARRKRSPTMENDWTTTPIPVVATSQEHLPSSMSLRGLLLLGGDHGDSVDSTRRKPHRRSFSEQQIAPHSSIFGTINEEEEQGHIEDQALDARNDPLLLFRDTANPPTGQSSRRMASTVSNFSHPNSSTNSFGDDHPRLGMLDLARSTHVQQGGQNYASLTSVPANLFETEPRNNFQHTFSHERIHPNFLSISPTPIRHGPVRDNKTTTRNDNIDKSRFECEEDGKPSGVAAVGVATESSFFEPLPSVVNPLPISEDMDDLLLEEDSRMIYDILFKDDEDQAKGRESFRRSTI